MIVMLGRVTQIDVHTGVYERLRQRVIMLGEQLHSFTEAPESDHWWQREVRLLTWFQLWAASMRFVRTARPSVPPFEISARLC